MITLRKPQIYCNSNLTISVPHSSQMSHPLSRSIDCMTNLNDAILAYLKLILVRMMSACCPMQYNEEFVCVCVCVCMGKTIKRMNINNYCLNSKLICFCYGSFN